MITLTIQIICKKLVYSYLHFDHFIIKNDPVQDRLRSVVGPFFHAKKNVSGETLVEKELSKPNKQRQSKKRPLFNQITMDISPE